MSGDLLAELVEARQALGLTQTEVAARLGITQTALSYWENGKRAVTLQDFMRWAGTLDRGDGSHADEIVRRFEALDKVIGEKGELPEEWRIAAEDAP